MSETSRIKLPIKIETTEITITLVRDHETKTIRVGPHKSDNLLDGRRAVVDGRLAVVEVLGLSREAKRLGWELHSIEGTP